MSLLLLLRSTAPVVTPPTQATTNPVPVVEIDFQGNPTATYADIQKTQDNAISFWRMNSATTFLDERLAHNGTIIGTPSTTASPYSYDSDLAMAFDGSADGAYVSSANDLTSKSNFTISGWLRIDSLPGGTRDAVAKRGAWLLQVTSAGKLVWTLKDDLSTATVTTNTTLAVNTWYHVAAVYDSVNISVYINGVLDNSTAYTQGWEAWSQPLRWAVTPSTASPTYQSNQAGSTNGGGAITTTKPTSTANGDLLIAHVSLSRDNVTATAPTGWTLLTQISAGTANTFQYVKTWLYYKIAASEPANYTWNFSGGISGSVTITRITGHDSIAPIANIAYTVTDPQNFGTVHSAGSHIPNVPNSLILTFCDAGWNGGAASFTWGSGTEAYDAGSASSGSSMSYRTQASEAAFSVSATHSTPSTIAMAANNIMLVIAGAGYTYLTASMKDWSFSDVARSTAELARDYAAKDSGTGTWTNVSASLRSVDVKGASRQYELDQMEAGTTGIVLRDENRYFDPANTSSIYSPNVIPMRKIRGRTTYQGTVYDLFYTYVERWPPDYRALGYQEIDLTTVDGFDALALANVSGALDVGYSGTQIDRLLDKALWPKSARALDAGQYVMAAQTLSGTAALSAIQEIAASERGIFFIDQAGVATFHDSAHRGSFSRSTQSQVTFIDSHSSSGIFYQDLNPSYDKDKIINDWTVAPDTSSFGAASQQLSDPSSVARFWRRSQTRTTRLVSNADALAQAGFLLNETSLPAQRFDSITVLPTSTAAYQACLGLAISDRVTVIRGTTPSWDGAVMTKDCFVEARTISAVGGEPWRFTFSLSPVSSGNYYSTILRDGPVSYWRMDTTT